ncbi:MAG TPA: bifunctional lysylphosphatidylglycerol flippase/synthetase MprF [Stellaceae bacterium]|nr:bifunctional lysylphosphatidylglycerol flippase/synthetase MprF [Stellaceae bacterium]
MTDGEAETLPTGRLLAVLRLVVAPLAILVVGGFLYLAVHHLGDALSYRALSRAVRRTPVTALLGALAATILSYLALLASDWCGVRYARVQPPRRALLLASFCGYALGNAAGFGSLSGGAVRYRIYSVAGLLPGQIAQIGAFLAVAFTAGALVTTAVAVLIAGAAVSRLTGLPPYSLRIGAGIILVLAAGFVGFAAWRRTPIAIGPWHLRLPSPALTIGQLAFTVLDIAAAGTVLWVLPPPGQVAFVPFIAIYAAAVTLGALSHVPGGIGVFDAAILAALGTKLPPSSVAGALVVYRAIYLLLPLCLAALSLAIYEMRRAAASGLAEPVTRAAARLTPTFLGVLAFAIGAVLLVSGATPAIGSRLALLKQVVPLWVVEASQLLTSVTGVLLLFVARGLLHRQDGAWWMAMGLTGVSLFFVLAKGVAIGTASLIAFFMIIMVLARRQFRRPASLLRQPLTIGWLAAFGAVVIAGIWLLLFAYQDVRYSRDLWWQFEFDAQAPRALRAVMGAVVIALVLAVWQLLRPPSGRVAPPTLIELRTAARILRLQDRADANLALLGDKSFLFSDSGAAFLMYAKRGRTWVALADPVGPRGEWRELVWRFVELVHSHGGRAAFYQVRPDSLPLYLDAGLNILKLGEEARLSLTDFDLRGGSRTDLRYALRRGERDGLTFEFVPVEAVRALLPDLAEISDEWLAQRGIREKGFSVAAFDTDFVAAQPVALLRENGRITAFATVMTTDLKAEATIGVMRQRSDASRFAMEFLFASLILHLKAEGFASFSLGMAPLSGLDSHPLASRWHRIAGFFRSHGGALYNFQGLRTFKNKFDPVWEPRYLAASGTLGPYLALADTAVIAGGGVKGVFAR